MAVNVRTALFASLGLLGCANPHSPSTDESSSTIISAKTPTAAAVALGATPLAVDKKGVPHFLRGAVHQPAMAASSATAAARTHVERLAPAWGVRSGSVPTLESIGEVRVAGGTIVRLRQMIDGLPVANQAGGEVRVMVAKDQSLVAASGTLTSTALRHARAPKFKDDDAAAIARAVTETYKGSFVAAFAPSTLATRSVARDGTRMFAGATGSVEVSAARARKAWVPQASGLTAAWIVEAYSSNAGSTSGEAFRTVIDAEGRVLSRTNLTANEAFTYRVWAETDGEFHPFDGPLADATPNATGAPNTTALPAYVDSNLVTVEGLNHPDGGDVPDAWLASGSTETLGNNVDAYTDLNAPDGLTFNDFRATLTAPPDEEAGTPGAFDRVYDITKSAIDSQGQQMAGITSLFYTINWMHDFWYDGGFTEAAGNGQNSNFGRGGEDRDAILAEAQDCAKCTPAKRNNANMSTPSDGFNPKMQVFVWTNDKRSLKVGDLEADTGTAAFGKDSFTISAGVVLAEDGVVLPAPAGTVTDACTALSAPVTGKIVLVDRGSCSAKLKALNVQTAGGVGIIIANNADGPAPGFIDDASITTPLTVGVLTVSKADGATIKAALTAGAVTAEMKRVLGAELEGTLDASVIAHEFGHYVHHRLTECNTTLCGAMSEGWGDFSALLTIAREGDDLDKAYPMAIYSTQSQASDAVYFGIRRAPYSVNPAINGLTYKNMANETPAPTTFPFNGGGPNAEVHNGGEVWASMLWEGYVALQKVPGAKFDDVRLKMRQYVVAGLLLAPPEATPTETRDALLAAVNAASPEDHAILAAAFARRGFGSCAISPDRDSVDFNGIVESFDVKGQAVPGNVKMVEQAACDGDGVLDAGEISRVTVEVSNPGPVDLTGVQVKLTSTNPAIEVQESSIAIGAVAAYGDITTVTFHVTLASSVSAPTAVDLQAEITSDNGCGPLDIPLAIRVNTDDQAEASATDTFDAGGSPWTPDEGTTQWSHDRKAPLDGFWHGDDSGFPSDTSLTSPALIAGDGAVTATWTQRYAFEGTVEEAFDGGVIEISTDEGETWADISTIVDPGYNVTITDGPTSISGHMAFGATNEAFPDTEVKTLDFGTSLAGKTFQLRFRVVSDPFSGAPGWDIDDLAFTGLTNKPFPALVTNAKACDLSAGSGSDDDEDDDDGGCQTGRTSSPTGLLAALAVLGVVVLRRRRR